MAKVMLHSVTLDADFPGREPLDPNDPHEGKFFEGAYRLFRQSAEADPYGQHSLTDDPDEADLIIFTELGGEGLFCEWVRHHPWFRKHREKSFIFEIGDLSVPLLPGLYASLCHVQHDDGRTRTGYYLRTDENPLIDYRPPPPNYEHLAVFIGALENHPVRGALAQQASERMLIEDTSAFAQRMLRASPEEKKQSFWPRYADAMASSAFALCPRGRGPGSVRLFEAMRMGRCPVIIADEWVRPARIDWSTCSITVAASQLPELERILEAELPRAAKLGQNARTAWESYYAPDVRFHWLVEDCLSILSHRRWPEAIAGRLAWRYLLTREQLRLFVTSKRHIFRLTNKLVI